MTTRKRTEPGEQRRMVEGATNFDYTGTDDDIPPPSLDHVRLDWGKPGRKLTKESTHQMQLLVAAGLPIPSACTALGLGTSWKHWGDRARKAEKEGQEPGWGPGESPDLAWLRAMEQAKAAFEASMVARIGAAAVNDWKAAAWLLERRAPQRYYPKNQLALKVDEKKTLEITTLSLDKLMEITKGILPDMTQVKVLSSDVDDTATARDAVEAELEPSD